MKGETGFAWLVGVKLRRSRGVLIRATIRYLTPTVAGVIFPIMKLDQLLARFSTEEACKTYLVSKRWPNGVECPKCGNKKVWHVTHRPFHWICKKCHKHGYRFSVITKTVFENTKYPLRTWFKVIFLMYNSKKGMSALQIHRMIGTGSYETAWYMCHRIRAAMKDEGFPKLLGAVEVDETFIGGKDKNRHRKNRQHTGTGGIGSGKVGVKHLKSSYPHKTVDHAKGEYVRGEVHPQNLESFWSLLKRGVMGTFHNVSKDYLPLYLAEFSFRHNDRKNPDIFGEIVAGC